MKKLICLLLAIVCVFSFVACADKENPDDSTDSSTDSVGKLDAINEIISSSLPTTIVTHVKYAYEDETFGGNYVTEIDRANNKSQFNFTYERAAIPGEDAGNSYKKSVTGLVQFKDGEVKRHEGADWQTLGQGYLELELSLSETKLKDIEFSEDGKSLTAKISAENTVRVFGSAISADGDVSLSIETNGEYLYNVSISYTAVDTGAAVTVNTSYEYAPVALDF